MFSLDIRYFDQLINQMELMLFEFQIDYVKLNESLYEIETCNFYSILAPLISQATKCKIRIANFYYDKSIENKTGDLLHLLTKDNVSCQYSSILIY